MLLPQYPNPGKPIEASWGVRVVDYLRALTPQKSWTVAVEMHPGGTTYRAAGKSAPSGGAVLAPVRKPWDFFRLEPLQPVDPEEAPTEMIVQLWPGQLSGLMPANMFDEFTVTLAGDHYFVAACTGSNGVLVTAEIEVRTEPPAAGTSELNNPPEEIEILVGVLLDGSPYNIAGKHLEVAPKEVLRISNDEATPYGLPYKSFWRWEVA